MISLLGHEGSGKRGVVGEDSAAGPAKRGGGGEARSAVGLCGVASWCVLRTMIPSQSLW